LGLAFLAAGVISVAGCVAIPVPTPTSKRVEKGSRFQISDEAVESIFIGKTSKKEILFRLGMPDLVCKGESLFAYRWTSSQVSVVGLFVVPEYIIVYPVFFGVAVHSTHLLLIEFAGDLVMRVEVTRGGILTHRPSSKDVLEWSGAAELVDTSGYVEDNPEYEGWATFQKGAWRQYLRISPSGSVECTERLSEVTAGYVMIERTQDAEIWRVKVFARIPGFHQGPQEREEGEEEITVAGEAVRCHWISGRTPSGWERKSLSEKVPGGLVRRECREPDTQITTEEITTGFGDR
jgi:hypothetical protein